MRPPTLELRLRHGNSRGSATGACKARPRPRVIRLCGEGVPGSGLITSVGSRPSALLGSAEGLHGVLGSCHDLPSTPPCRQRAPTGCRRSTCRRSSRHLHALVSGPDVPSRGIAPLPVVARRLWGTGGSRCSVRVSCQRRRVGGVSGAGDRRRAAPPQGPSGASQHAGSTVVAAPAWTGRDNSPNRFSGRPKCALAPAAWAADVRPCLRAILAGSQTAARGPSVPGDSPQRHVRSLLARQRSHRPVRRARRGRRPGGRRPPVRRAAGRADR
jgi:hypothetical protein